MPMKLNDLLHGDNFDPKQVLVLRHRPQEAELKQWLPWLAAEKPDVFNAYQQTQGEKLQKVMRGLTGAGYVASFIGHEPGKALFVGLYAIASSKPITYEEYWEIPANVELQAYRQEDTNKADWPSSLLWFDLVLTNFCASWKGKLIVNWPPPELSWWRWAHRNELNVHAILEDNALVARRPEWDEILLTWDQLHILPTTWRSALQEWRGIYYIFDGSDGKGYVGSAYGKDNLLGRWQNYAASGDGGNRLLQPRDPSHFQFSILERVSPDMKPEDVIKLESSWKDRLHTRAPHGLNAN
jgi:hypothetical protein